TGGAHTAPRGRRPVSTLTRKALAGRHPERSRSSGGARDLARIAYVEFQRFVRNPRRWYDSRSSDLRYNGNVELRIVLFYVAGAIFLSEFLDNRRHPVLYPLSEQLSLP